jgi:hypothetical protein
MQPTYIPGSPVGLHHILSDWLYDRALPIDLIVDNLLAPGIEVWFLMGGQYLTAEISGQWVFGWQPKFALNAADPEFFEKLEAVILNAERGAK